MIKSMLTIALAALLSACAHAPAPAVEVKLQQPLPGLYTAGQPAPGDWQALAARGVTTIINLRAPGELKGRDEAAEVQAAGLRYVEIPVAGGEGINADNARLLHAALGDRHGGVLVHCASGNRVGALLALEQVEFDGLPREDAVEFGKRAGVTGLEGKLKQVLGLEAPVAQP